MTSVKLKIRVSSIIEKEGTLYFQVIHKRLVRQIKTPYSIYRSEWDRDKNEIIDSLKVSKKRRKKISLIRTKIEWEKHRLNQVIAKFEKEGKPFSTNDIVKEYIDALSNKTTVFEYIKTQIEHLSETGRERTSETYKQTLQSFMKFRNNEDLCFDMIDEKLLSQYEVYMRISNLCRNTTSFYMRILRSIYNRAVNEGHTIQTNPFKNVYTGVDKTCKRAITLQEIKRIKNMDLSDMPKLDFARDIFMFSFYMRGMSFIDIAYLKKTDLSGGFLVYNRKKTGQQLIVKWEKDMDNIVQKYADENENNAFLFPIIERQDGTERKQYLNKMLIINRRLKTISKMGNISTPLTMYVARHSWASIAQSKNIPVHTISLAMGHDNEETTRIYLATIQNNVIDKANNKIISLLNRRE